MYDIFISYRTTHSDWVETLAFNLKDQGYNVFFDRWALVPGGDFPAQIHKALNASRCAILVATPDAADSGWVQQELQIMVNRKNSEADFFFIPVVMGRFPDLPFVETVQAVDFGDSDTGRYRLAFHRLLCGVRQEPPGPDKPFEGKLRLPIETSAVHRPLVISESSFVEHLFMQVETGRPLMILAQADTDTQVYADTIRRMAESRYGAAQVLHIYPPNSERADNAACFGRLARQCGFKPPVSESWQWADLLGHKLGHGAHVLLMVTGFENGPDLSRKELAGELRNLCTDYYPRFHLIMMGSRKLAALKYENGDHSLLNFADEVTIPEPSPEELLDQFGRIYPKLELTLPMLEETLAFTGCHPRLVHLCLQQGADSAQACRELLDGSPLPAQLFTQFRDPSERSRLEALLDRTDLGRYDPWPTDELLRRLYWCNLITCRQGRFQWRCDYIRQTGREMAVCR